MKRILSAFALILAAQSLTLAKAAPGDAEDAAGVQISPDRARLAAPGPGATFTGEVTVKPLFDADGVRDLEEAEVTSVRPRAPRGTPTPAVRP